MLAGMSLGVIPAAAMVLAVCSVLGTSFIDAYLQC